MHELALSRAIVGAALRHAEGRAISTVHVRIGSLRQAVPASLSFYFEIVARETGCEGARLELEPVAARLRCPRCGREWDPEPAPLAKHAALPGDGLPPRP
ncbi:MAG: hydrogenase maturation nickel metallochaperone HypA, partial [Solirubrobacterales bacterium]